MEKTTVFHLIILDESGSMRGLSAQTVSGCNETLNTIRSLNKKFGDTQRNLVSIYLFQSDSEIPSRYLFKNKPIAEINDLTPEEYRPWGCTPLLDAVGSTLVDLQAVSSTHEDATGIVTIITDGMENSSENYDWQKVGELISRLKEMGWTFNFIGANIDVEAVSQRMNIQNARSFQATCEDTAAMWKDFSECLVQHESARVMHEQDLPMTREARIMSRKAQASGFFDSSDTSDTSDTGYI